VGPFHDNEVDGANHVRNITLPKLVQRDKLGFTMLVPLNGREYKKNPETVDKEKKMPVNIKSRSWCERVKQLGSSM
jgi:hypothetical protein